MRERGREERRINPYTKMSDGDNKEVSSWHNTPSVSCTIFLLEVDGEGGSVSKRGGCFRTITAGLSSRSFYIHLFLPILFKT
jgi:hypothetical protein